MTERYKSISYGECDDGDGFFAYVCDGPVNVTAFGDTQTEAFKLLANALVEKLSFIRYAMDETKVTGLKGENPKNIP